MGSQQLLLIILGVILVGVSIVVGINLSLSNAVENNRQELINRINLVSDLAMAYYKKPVEQGGGGGSFLDFDINSILKESRARERIVGRVTISFNARRERLTINTRGVEIGKDGRRVVMVRGIVTAQGLSLTIQN